MAAVTLPAGCTGLDFADGTRYDAPRQGSTVEVAAGHAGDISRSWYGSSGLIGATRYAFGTRAGRRCPSCRRLWNAWNRDCPRCHAPTTFEE